MFFLGISFGFQQDQYVCRGSDWFNLCFWIMPLFSFSRKKPCWSHSQKFSEAQGRLSLNTSGTGSTRIGRNSACAAVPGNIRSHLWGRVLGMWQAEHRVKYFHFIISSYIQQLHVFINYTLFEEALSAAVFVFVGLSCSSSSQSDPERLCLQTRLPFPLKGISYVNGGCVYDWEGASPASARSFWDPLVSLSFRSSSPPIGITQAFQERGWNSVNGHFFILVNLRFPHFCCAWVMKADSGRAPPGFSSCSSTSFQRDGQRTFHRPSDVRFILDSEVVLLLSASDSDELWRTHWLLKLERTRQRLCFGLGNLNNQTGFSRPSFCLFFFSRLLLNEWAVFSCQSGQQLGG